MKTLPLPCPACPWREDAVASAIPHFDLAKAEHLATTCPDARGMGPDFLAPIFACHQSKIGAEFTCAGWLAVVGHCHPQVRLAVMRGELDEKALVAGDDWPRLHASFGEVIRKLRATGALRHG